MTVSIAFVLLVVLGAMVLFVKEWVSSDLVGILLMIVLILGGQLDPKTAFSAFGNEALITVASMYVLAAGLIRTGAVAFIGRRLLASGKGSEARILLMLMLVSAACSAFINNTPIVVIFLPIVLGIAESSDIRASKLLIPLSYSTIIGGMCTLIGTSTNVLVSSMLPRFHLEPLSFFAPMPLALIGLAMSLLYMAVIGRRLLPSRTTVSGSVRAGRLSDYVTEIELAPGGPFAGKSLAEMLATSGVDAQVLQLIRGEEILPIEGRMLLRDRDLLIVKGEVNALLALQRIHGLTLAPELAHPAFEARARDLTLAELLVRPTSAAIGELVRDLNLRQRYGVFVLAVQRHGFHIRQSVADLQLRLGDVLLIQADAEALSRLRGAHDFVLLEGVDRQVILTHRAELALGVVAAVVALATMGIPGLPISVLSLTGALAMVGSRCLSLREAYRAIDLPILVLIAGTICLGVAMEKSGAAAWIAGGLVSASAMLGPVGLLSAVYLMTNVLTALIANTGAAILMLPIALAAAADSGLAPTPFVLAVMFAASIDFSTPIGYQTNTIIYGPGGYHFSDYAKVGLPLNVLWWLLATVFIPLFWPLRPA